MRTLLVAELPFQLRAHPGVVLEDLGDPADLVLVAGQSAPITRVEEIQEGERALRVLELRVLQLADHERTQLWSGPAVLSLGFLERGDRLAPRITERHVVIGAPRIPAPHPLDERPNPFVADTS